MSQILTVTSDNFDLQYFKLRASNPRTIAYVQFNMPSESSNLPGAGLIFPDQVFENWPCDESRPRLSSETGRGPSSMSTGKCGMHEGHTVRHRYLASNMARGT